MSEDQGVRDAVEAARIFLRHGRTLGDSALLAAVDYVRRTAGWVGWSEPDAFWSSVHRDLIASECAVEATALQLQGRTEEAAALIRRAQLDLGTIPEQAT